MAPVFAAGPITPVQDLIRREFTASAPGQRLVGNIIGHAMADHMRTTLVCDAIDLAAARGLIAHNAVFHSDRGSNRSARDLASAFADQVGRVDEFRVVRVEAFASQAGCAQ